MIYPMTIRTLKIFVAVAEEKTMHAAAKKLFISQPSVSQAISELEKEYNVKLFERLSQRLYITDTGQKLLSYAYHLLGTYDEIHDFLTHQGNLNRLRIGSSVSVGTCMLNDIITKMQAQKPNTELYVTIDNTSEIENLILNNSLDVGLVEGLITSPDLLCQKVCEDELIIVAAPCHPLANKKNLHIEDLSGQTFISRESGSNDRNQFDYFLREHHIQIKKSWVCTNTQAIKNAVIHGNGLAILSRMLVQTELQEGSLIHIHFKDICIKRDIRLVYHKDKYLSHELLHFAAICGVML